MCVDNPHTHIHTRTPEFYEVPILEPESPGYLYTVLWIVCIEKLKGQYSRKGAIVFLRIVWGWLSRSKTISSASAKNTINDNWKDHEHASVDIRWSSKMSTDPSHEETYRVRLGSIRFHPLGPGVLGRRIGLLSIATLLLISGFVEYHCESISGSWVIHVPFTKLRQGAT
jgi:hypothetical protein